jgi:glycosyltransferase involved in cell wall biosynthesis
VKILHVVPTYVPAWRYGGPIVAVHGLCKALASRGHEVHVFTTNVDGPATLDVPTATPVEVDGVSVRYFPSRFPRLYWSPQMKRALSAGIGGYDISGYDIVHSHAVYLWPGVAAARAARTAGVPYVISPRGMLVPELIAQKSRFTKTAWLRLFERAAFAGAARIHFTSRLEWDDAMRVGLPLPAPFIVPNGVELPQRPAVTREEDLLLFLGRITWKKRLDLAIDAVAGHPTARLVIAGNDDESLTPQLQEQATRLGVGARVTFVGPVYGEAKQELLSRAALFVLLSTSENFGNAVLEALAMETPVVLSRGVGVAEEVVGAGAGAFGSESIAPLLADRALRERMGRAGRALVAERFAWNSVAAAMENAYMAAAEPSARGMRQ